MGNATVTIGATIKKKFFMSLFCGLIVFSGLLGVFGFTGTMFALPLGGMGDFYVEFDRLDGQGFKMSPHIGETGNQDAAPLVRNEIETATVKGLHIYKDLKLPTGNWIRINIRSEGTTTISGLIQDARFVEANLSFNQMEMKNNNTSNVESALEEFQNNWGQSADVVTIVDAKIVTDYLFQNLVSLNGAKISIEGIGGPEQNSNGSGNKEETDSSIVAGGSNGPDHNTGNGEGNALPDSASNLFLPIVIGGMLFLIGSILLILKRRKTTTDIKF